MSTFFEYEIRLNGLDVDNRGQCKASALLNHLQNAAALAAEDGGFSRDVLVERYGAFWMLARLMGYTNEQLYNLSQKIIGSEKKAKSNNCFFGEAYNVSYTDVYDFCSKKQSLKKWPESAPEQRQRRSYTCNRPRSCRQQLLPCGYPA